MNNQLVDSIYGETANMYYQKAQIIQGDSI